MRRVLSTLFLLCFALPAHAQPARSHNVFMGQYQNQMAFNFGQGVDSGFIVASPTRIAPFYFFNLQYSQPTTFFTIPARQSVNIGQTLGFGRKYGWDWHKYTIPMIFLSEDIALVEHKNFYFGGGAGMGLQAQQNERLGAKLLFQFKLTAGLRFKNHWGMELFMMHFSNANTAPENYSYAFYGLGATYSF